MPRFVLKDMEGLFIEEMNSAINLLKVIHYFLYPLRFISWLVSKVYNRKWKILDIKRTPVKKRIFLRQKWLRKMHLKNAGFTYKKSNFKVYDTTKSVLQKSCRMISLNVLDFLYTNDNSLLGCLKCKKHAILSTFSKNPIILSFWLFLHSKKGFS